MSEIQDVVCEGVDVRGTEGHDEGPSAVSEGGTWDLMKGLGVQRAKEAADSLDGY